MSDDEALGWIEEWFEAGVEIVGDSDVNWDLFAELVSASRRSLRNGSQAFLDTGAATGLSA